MRWWVVVAALCVAALLQACERSPPASGAEVEGVRAKSAGRAVTNPAVSALRGPAVAVMGAAADGVYARALSARQFEFPADHGPHKDFQTEWWYFTGNLRAEDGRRFGFQLTLFRRALAPEAPDGRAPRASRFATRQAWMGHFALSDVDGFGDGAGDGAGRFHAFERLERGAAGLAGAQAQPFRVWIRDWQVATERSTENRTAQNTAQNTAQGAQRGIGAGPRTERGRSAGGIEPLGTPQRSRERGRAREKPAGTESHSETLFPLRLRAAQSGIAVDLILQRGKALVLQGERGLSRKSANPGNASYYYSYTRLPATGRVRTPAGEFQVAGQAWLDREWSSSALAPDQSGWDWFALQLADGRELMAYRLRDRHGQTHPYSAGMLVAKDGTLTPFTVEQMHFEAGRMWRSPDGEQYPVNWNLRAGSLQLRVQALFDAQAHRGQFRYWEGAVRVLGRDGEQPVSGQGYLEMTGY